MIFFLADSCVRSFTPDALKGVRSAGSRGTEVLTQHKTLVPPKHFICEALPYPPSPSPFYGEGEDRRCIRIGGEVREHPSNYFLQDESFLIFFLNALAFLTKSLIFLFS